MVLRDFFDGLVAAGTLALAGVTYRLGRATSNSVKEAYRSRIDDSAHRVLPHGLTVAPARVVLSIEGSTDLLEIEEGTPWDLALDGSFQIGVRANLNLRNEGAVSGLVRFDLPEGVELYEPEVELGPTAPGFERQNEEWLVLPPQTDAEIGFIWWQSAERWALAADAFPVPSSTITMTISDATGGAADTCKVTFGARVLSRDPVEKDWVIAAHVMDDGITNSPPRPVTFVSSLTRTYPGEPTTRSWFSSLRS